MYLQRTKCTFLCVCVYSITTSRVFIYASVITSIHQLVSSYETKHTLTIYAVYTLIIINLMFERVKQFCKFRSKVKDEKIVKSVNDDTGNDPTRKSITKCVEDVDGYKEAESSCLAAERGCDVIVSDTARYATELLANDTSKNSESCSAFVPKDNSRVEILEEDNEHPETQICSASFEALSELENLQPAERSYLLDKLDGSYPPVDFFDYCIIASEKDFELAENLVELLKNVGLTGCVAGSSLGGDILEECNDLVTRCTKVLFLVTENFTADGFCKRLQSATVFQSLITRIAFERNKCVPVYSGDSGARRIPLPLMGIAGINLLEPDTIIPRIKATYTFKVRYIKILKAQKYLEQRKKFCSKLFIEHRDPALSISAISNSDSYSSSFNFQKIKYHQPTSPPVSQDCESSCPLSPVQGIVQNVQSLVAGFSMTNAVSEEENFTQECSYYESDNAQQLITIENSSDVHVGHQINLTVNVHNAPVTTVQSTNLD